MFVCANTAFINSTLKLQAAVLEENRPVSVML